MRHQIALAVALLGISSMLCMDRDGIQERGTHAQLLEKENGIYKELYEAQFARI